MPLSPVASQKWYFYTKKWDAKNDHLLITTLLSKKEAFKPLLPVESPHAIVDAMDMLNNTYKAGIRVLDIHSRIEFLRKRFVTFKELSNMPETDWELPKNRVHVADDVWARLFEANDFYKAYRYKGEPEFFQLASLFGEDDVKKEASHTVIVIDDSSRREEEASHLSISDTSSDDEVTSPQPSIGGKVSRKLYFDDACSSIIPITTEYPTHITAPWLDIERNYRIGSSTGFPPTNVFPPKPKDHTRTPDSGVGGSSCASSSPFK